MHIIDEIRANKGVVSIISKTSIFALCLMPFLSFVDLTPDSTLSKILHLTKIYNFVIDFLLSRSLTIVTGKQLPSCRPFATSLETS
ncbi:unnamed protein product, partial [Mesorhabditis belari]|uniref:Uncharacterized protein n=1 Tax=Mesorhabditis belari TaxID=2138241 RepID=A0AAF3EXM9_9BILA